MGLDLFFWLVLCLPLNFTLLASTFYQVLILSDLEADFINPYDASSRINYFIVPEFIGQGLLYMKQTHLIDVTEVFRLLSAEKKFRIAKILLIT
ncbi:hypothetical protein GLYMA_03G141500v4 [Glycine max]|uniref:Uncharacterized protein n=1 Tax=Glycine max TaxID=3847 RepID=K7KF02_SOYBN|nr:hypothetical protein GYH30_007196 [Glycine max]KAH1069959.1 hypothetical protein GYH30_007196 [Glycine max]KAH1069960.1 hypothetical protein GYH30_007196 [Glycine max]KAH1069964.1 hypothetical protein GYH30_007196 [Glycine max]KRH67013.1 hypothetical protein GLYMA_03G141500v4 [Glycine max]